MLEGNPFASIRFGVLITSDRSAAGEREDATGPQLKNLLEQNGGTCVEVMVVPDDTEAIQSVLRLWSADPEIEVILTSGGTGIGSRDVTVDATRVLLDKELPGFGEEMRRRSMEKTPTAILSRATAGAIGNTFILNLPGSPKGALECLTWIAIPLGHAVKILRKEISDCQTEIKKFTKSQ